MSDTTKLHNTLDTVFSKYIVLWTKFNYGKCPFCGGPIECCFHFITRSKFGTRWNVLNAIGSCFKCNSEWESITNKDQSKFMRWIYRTMGKHLWESVILKSNTVLKYDKSELEGMITHYKAETAKLGVMIAKSKKPTA